MTVLVVLGLVAIWIIVLTPPLWRKYFEYRGTLSIVSFHQRLHSLEQTGPKLVEPAHRLANRGSSKAAHHGASGYPTLSSRPGRPKLVLLRSGVPGDEPTGISLDEHKAQRRDRRRLDDRRRQARRRRRHVLCALFATFVVTALLGIPDVLHFLWIFTALAGVALMGFVGLAIYAQSLVEAPRAARVARVVRRSPSDPRENRLATHISLVGTSSGASQDFGPRPAAAR